LRLDTAGYPFIGGALAIGLIAGVAAGWLVGDPVRRPLAVLSRSSFATPNRTPPPATTTRCCRRLTPRE